MKSPSQIFSEYADVLQFLSKSVRPYGLENNKLVEVAGDEGEWFFYSSSMLEKKNWSVMPLWGANLSGLAANDGRVVDLTEIMKSFFLRKKMDSIFYAIMERSSKLWYSDILSFTIAGGKYSVFNEFGDFFGIRAGLGPYMGNVVIWPEDESFMIYSDGDNISFIAGDRAEMEGLLQAPYQYCMDQFLDYNKRNLSVPAIYVSMANFCDEHLK